MTMHNRNHHVEPEKKFSRDQLLTLEDLQNFKSELIDTFKTLVQEGNASRKWLRSREVRKILSISPGTLQNLRINGTLPYAKVGGVIFYDWQEINAVLESHRIDHSL